MKKYSIVALTLIPFLLHSCNFFGQDKPISQIPFTINNDGLMIISLQINNEEVSNFVLDTGASVTVIDKKIATQLDLTLHEEIYESTGVNGVVNRGIKTRKQRVSLKDKIVLEGIKLSVADLSRLGTINGLIGFDLFREYVTETNFDTKTISFYKRKGKPDTKGYTSIAFVESFCTPEINVSVSLSNNKSFSGKVLFDTGNVSTPLSFNTPFVNKHELSSKFEGLITSESRGIHSAFTTRRGTIPSIEIKKFKVLDIPVDLSNSKQGMSSKEDYMGNLGLKYISKFNFILDYNKKKIYLKPNKSYTDAFRFPLSGIGLETKENEIFIKSIAKPSMAYDKGLRAGQQLISINGIKGKEIQLYKDALLHEGEEVSIVVKLEDGTLKTVEILLARLI